MLPLSSISNVHLLVAFAKINFTVTVLKQRVETLNMRKKEKYTRSIFLGTAIVISETKIGSNMEF